MAPRRPLRRRRQRACIRKFRPPLRPLSRPIHHLEIRPRGTLVRPPKPSFRLYNSAKYILQLASPSLAITADALSFYISIMWTNLKASRISLHPISHLLPIHHVLPSLFSPSATSPPSTPFSIPHPKPPPSSNPAQTQQKPNKEPSTHVKLQLRPHLYGHCCAEAVHTSTSTP
jgi:hypothetical protein